MKLSKICLLGFLVLIFLSLNFIALAADNTEQVDETADQHKTVLPKSLYNVSECEKIMFFVELNKKDAKNAVANRGSMEVNFPKETKSVTGTDILGCGIKTGTIKFWMVPFYIRYGIEYILGLAGLITVGGIIYGGYLYLFAGISESKDKGKSAIKNVLIGFVLVLTSWAIVNIVVSLVTM